MYLYSIKIYGKSLPTWKSKDSKNENRFKYDQTLKYTAEEVQGGPGEPLFLQALTGPPPRPKQV